MQSVTFFFSVQTKLTLEHCPPNKKPTFSLYAPTYAVRPYSQRSHIYRLHSSGWSLTTVFNYWKKSTCKWACSSSCSSRVNCQIISVTTYRDNVLKAVTPTWPSGNALKAAPRAHSYWPAMTSAKQITSTLKPGMKGSLVNWGSMSRERQENGKEEHLSKHTIRHRWSQAEKARTSRSLVPHMHTTSSTLSPSSGPLSQH